MSKNKNDERLYDLLIDKLDDHNSNFDRLDASFDLLDDRLVSIDKTLDKQHGQLVEHIRRSEANEKALDLLKAEIKPVVTFIDRFRFSVKLFLALGAISFGFKFLLSLVA